MTPGAELAETVDRQTDVLRSLRVQLVMLDCSEHVSSMHCVPHNGSGKIGIRRMSCGDKFGVISKDV